MSDANADIHALFAAYGAGFDDADSGRRHRSFRLAGDDLQFGEGHVFEDSHELSENVDALMDVFDEAGIVSTTPEVKEVRMAGSAAFAHVVWRQVDGAGELLHEFSCQYFLLDHDGARASRLLSTRTPGERVFPTSTLVEQPGNIPVGRRGWGGLLSLSSWGC